MNWVDATVLLVVALSMAVGIVRGVVRELFFLAGWVLAFLAAWLFGPDAARLIGNDLIGDALVRSIVGHVFLFLIVLIGMATLAQIVSKLVHGVGLGLPDRIAGAIYGIARGALVTVLLAMMAGLSRLPASDEWRSAETTPYLELAVLALKPWLPQAFANRINFRDAGAAPRRAGVNA